jgi:hypothetical protein
LGYQKLRPANEQKLGFPACARDPQELGKCLRPSDFPVDANQVGSIVREWRTKQENAALPLRLTAMDVKRASQEFTTGSLPARFGADSVSQAKSEAA